MITRKGSVRLPDADFFWIIPCFVTSQFMYIAWMFHSRKLNNCNNSMYTWKSFEELLGTFKELLGKSNSVAVLHKNL